MPPRGPGRQPAARRHPQVRRASFGRMTNDKLAAFYRRYNACCNEHRFEDLAELRAVVHAFPDDRWELRRLVVDAPPSRSSLYTASMPDGLPRCGLGLPRAPPRTA